MSDFDTMLRRTLRSGNEYDALFPKALCKSTYVGNGDTDFSIDEMKKVIEQYAFQTEKVAQKLQKPTLKATTDNIHDFLFNHFQYLADESNQLLRSPACSWFTRKKGIDCKSYSILASCILTNLEITHYIRKIKQPGYAPDEYTHVYVIVPIDQETGSLESGYHVIDGTLKSNIEPAFIGKSDLQMSLEHYSLNGATSKPLNAGLNLGFNDIKGLASQVSINNIKSIVGGVFDSIFGCKDSNSAFTSSMSTVSLNNIEKYYSTWIENFNKSILEKNFVTTSKLVAEFKSNTDCWIESSNRKGADGYNKCTTENIGKNIRAFLFFKSVIYPLLMAYMDDYFDKIAGEQTFVSDSNLSERPDLYGFHFTYHPNRVTYTIAYPNVKPKPKNIPVFFIPKQVIESTNSGTPFNLDSVLKLMEAAGTLIAVVSPGSNPSNPQNGGANPNSGSNPQNGGSYVQDLPSDTKTSNAGMTYVVGGAILIAGIAIAAGKFKN